jgi:hypothetical protein
MIKRKNIMLIYTICFMVACNIIFFLQAKNTVGIDAGDFNYKILAFYSESIFHDAFEPILISINGLWQNLLGHLFLVKKLIPINYPHAVQIYQGILFLPFTVLIITLVYLSNKNLIPSLIFLTGVMMSGRDVWFAYHLDKHFSFFCLFLYFYKINKKAENEINKYEFIIMIAGILAYPITVLLYLYGSMIRLCNSSHPNMSHNILNCLFIITLLLGIKYLSLGENTYLQFDPLGDNYRIPNLFKFFFNHLDVNFAGSLNYLTSVILLNVFFIINKINTAPVIRKMVKSLITILVISTIVILVNIFIRRIGFTVPIWQFLSIQILTFWLLVCALINSLIFKLLVIIKNKYLLENNMVQNHSVNSLLLSSIFIILCFKSALYNEGIRKSHLQEREMTSQIKKIEVLYSENKECTESKNFGSFGSAYIRLKYNEKRILPFSHDFANPKTQLKETCENKKIK